MKNLAKLVVSVLLLAFMVARESQASVIYQAFDERFSDVEAKLAALKGAGYAIVQLSPPKRSRDSSAWWARYQPIDFSVIDSPLGDESDLRDLVAAAHKLELKVLVDVVFNHMANSDDLRFPQFSPQDFHGPQTRECIRDYNDRYQVTHFWLCSGPGDPGLPDLDTSSAHVRSVHKAYLAKLVAIGVDGFRFDAARHIEPEFFAEVLSSTPTSLYNYGEIISNNQSEVNLYQPVIDVTDFKLLSTMINAFSLTGDLRSLVHPIGNQAELSGTRKVVFARNHDTAMNREFYNFGDQQDSLLATAYVLARGVGVGFVYRDDAFDPLVVQATRFHNLMEGRSVYVRAGEEVCGQNCDARTLLFIERGDEGVAMLNSADRTVSVNYAQMSGLRPGCYGSLDGKISVMLGRPNGQNTQFLSWSSNNQSQAQRSGFVLPPRSVTFLVKSATDDCH